MAAEDAEPAADDAAATLLPPSAPDEEPQTEDPFAPEEVAAPEAHAQVSTEDAEPMSSRTINPALQELPADQMARTQPVQRVYRRNAPHRYFNKKAVPKHDMRPQMMNTAPDAMWQHQAQPCRSTPHPVHGAQRRWPDSGYVTGNSGRLFNDFKRQKPRQSLNQKQDLPAAPEMTLDEIRLILCRRFGGLGKAFDHMCFFLDGKLSAIEWQEGVHRVLVQIFGADSHIASVPRGLFNQRMQRLFETIDTDQDGLITFDELTLAYLDPPESGHQYTIRRKIEEVSFAEASIKPGLMAAEAPKSLGKKGLAKTDASGLLQTLANRTCGMGLVATNIIRAAAVPSGDAAIYDFATALLGRFPNIDAAFDALDSSGMGQMSLAEFQAALRSLRIKVDAEAIFKALDASNNGTIRKSDFSALRQVPIVSSKTEPAPGETTLQAPMIVTRKMEFTARRDRSPIVGPAKFARGQTLASQDLTRPLSEKMTSAAGFHTFAREATGRLDKSIHPSQVPGTDHECFTPEHGPGFCAKGPERYPYMGLTDHPICGNKWKVGANMNRTGRFGPLVPSYQGARDRELAGISYATYDGQFPQDGFQAQQTGAMSIRNRTLKTGLTFKAEISMRSASEPNLKRKH